MRRGAIAILPLAFGAALYGFAFGVLAAQVGFPWWGVAAMSASVHAGSSQIVAVEQLSHGAGLAGAVLAGAALNLRYLGIIASCAPMLRGWPWPARLLAIHVSGDENWALTMSERARDPGVGARFLLGSGLVMITVWTLSTSAGALAGTATGDLERLGRGFAFTAAFIAMARGMWRGARALPSWGAAFAAAALAVSSGVAPAYGIVLGTLSGLAVSALARRLEGPA